MKKTKSKSKIGVFIAVIVAILLFLFVDLKKVFTALRDTVKLQVLPTSKGTPTNQSVLKAKIPTETDKKLTNNAHLETVNFRPMPTLTDSRKKDSVCGCS